jgi:hypothetical protein
MYIIDGLQVHQRQISARKVREDVVPDDIATHVQWMLTHDKDLEDIPDSLKQEILERFL